MEGGVGGVRVKGSTCMEYEYEYCTFSQQTEGDPEKLADENNNNNIIIYVGLSATNGTDAKERERRVPIE